MIPFWALQKPQNYDQGGDVYALGATPKLQPQDTQAPAQNTTLSGPSSISQGAAPGHGNYGASIANGAKNAYGYLTAIPGVGKEISKGLDSVIGGIFDPLTNKFQAGAAPIQQGTNVGQINNAYDQSQQALQQQQALVTALQGQNGIGNQSNVYNQFQGIANGTGPNPALAQLNQSTGQNVANQAALMAGQRGAGANAGLIARQAAQQGANTQQNSIGQAATLQAQQQQNALNSMSGIAGQQIGNQVGATQNLNAQVQNEQGILQGANNNYNANMVNMQGNMNNVNAGVAAGNQNAAGQLFGGAMSAVGSVMSMFAGGGEVQQPGQLAPMPQMQAAPIPQAPSGPISSAGQFLNTQLDSPIGQPAPYEQAQQSDWFKKGSGGVGGGKSSGASGMSSTQGPAMAGGAGDMGGMAGSAGMMMAASGGPVKALVSPGENYLRPRDVEQVKAGANPMSVGEKIPGKPKVGGAKNSYSNDTVPKTLEEGGIVLPRSVTQSKDAPDKAAAFVRAILAKQGHK